MNQSINQSINLNLYQKKPIEKRTARKENTLKDIKLDTRINYRQI